MDMLDFYSDYLIFQNKYATATGLSDLVDGAFAHDKVTRFLRFEDFGSKSLWGYIKKAVRSQETVGGVLILDDSIEEKPYTDENEINGWHYSHLSYAARIFFLLVGFALRNLRCDAKNRLIYVS